MRRLLNQIGNRLQAFIDQRDDIALVLCSPASDALPLLKILEGLEESSTSDLYWIVTDNFVEPVGYAGAVVKAFATRHEVVRLAIGKRGMAPWPPIPQEILSDTTAPVERLRALAAFSRTLLPVPNGGTNVWVYFPLELANPGAFAGLMAEVLRHEFPFPWCHHLRFIVREDPSNRALARRLPGAPRIQWYQPDLGTEAVNRALEEEATDDSLPLAERMAMVPMLAGTDFAWGRYPAAMQKYGLLLRYHGATNNHAMAAFSLNGMGEVYEKMGDLDRANQSYEAALIPASHGEQPAMTIWLNVVVNLGNLCIRQQRWGDGEAYFDVAQQLAAVARDATTKISALEHRGICQDYQGKVAEAEQSWRAGLIIAAQLEDVASCRGLLRRLEEICTRTGQHAAAFELHEQLTLLDTPEAATA
jgi:tetratricopeptide (TPR) repeat protein